MRALRLAIEHWILQRSEIPFHFPISSEQAESLGWIESRVDDLSNVAGGGSLVPHVVQWDPTKSFGGDRTVLGDENDELGRVDSDDLVDSDSDSNMDDFDTDFGIRTVCF